MPDITFKEVNNNTTEVRIEGSLIGRIKPAKQDGKIGWVYFVSRSASKAKSEWYADIADLKADLV